MIDWLSFSKEQMVLEVSLAVVCDQKIVYLGRQSKTMALSEDFAGQLANLLVCVQEPKFYKRRWTTMSAVYKDFNPNSESG